MRRLPKSRPPTTAELLYRRYLLRLVVRIREEIALRVIPQLPWMVHEAAANRPSADAVTLDAAWTGRVGQLLADVADSTNADEGFALIGLPEVANRVDTLNRSQWARIASAALGAKVDRFRRPLALRLGVSVLSMEPWLKETIDGFVAENVALVKDLRRSALSRIEAMILRQMRLGVNADTLARDIREDLGIARNRALLIAVDQILKLNGKLTEYRNVEFGVDEYFWRTVGDMKVRPEHARREGQRFKWSAPPYDGHPGQPVRCRCHSEPVIAGINA